MGLLKALRFAKENLRDGLKDDNAHWHDTPYHSEDATAYDNFEADYGLPEGLDLNVPPEVAFPSPPAPVTSETDNCPLKTDNCFSSPMPTVAYCKHGPGCPEHTIRTDYPETPELAELREIQANQGIEAAAERYKQQQRNRQRRQVAVGRKRYRRHRARTQPAPRRRKARPSKNSRPSKHARAAQGAQPKKCLPAHPACGRLRERADGGQNHRLSPYGRHG